MTGNRFCCWARAAGDNRAAPAAKVLRKSRRLILVLALRPLFSRVLLCRWQDREGRWPGQAYRSEKGEGAARPVGLSCEFAWCELTAPVASPIERRAQEGLFMVELSPCCCRNERPESGAPGDR